jgi:ribose transport system permease protein
MSESIGEATAAVMTSKVTRKSTPRVAIQLEKYGVLVAWVAVILFFSLMMPETFPTLATGRLILGTQTVILITTLGLMLSLAVGEFDLSVGSVVGFAGSLMVVLNGVLGWGPLEAFVTTIVASLLFGALNAFLAVYVGVQSIIVTLGTGTLLAGLTLAVTSSKVVTGLSPGVVQFMTTPLLGIPIPFYIAVILTVICWFVLQHTPLGRRMNFVQANREVARLSGLRVQWIRAGGLMATSLFGGLAGVVLAGTNGAANPQAGAYYLLPAFAAAFLGSTAIIPGRFNAFGTFVAVYFLVTGITGLQYLGYAGWPEQIFYGSSLVVAVTIGHLVGRRRGQGL